MIRFLNSTWNRLPAIIRAPIIAFIVLQIGALASVAAIFGNLNSIRKFHGRFQPRALVRLAIVANKAGTHSNGA